MPLDDTIRKRDHERLREWFLTLGSPVQSREIRVVLQYLQALDVCDLLTQSAERQAELASAALFRFGLDTLATGFWIACVATDEWLRGQERFTYRQALSAQSRLFRRGHGTCSTKW